MEHDTEKMITAVHKSFDIIEALKEANGARIKELDDALELSKSSIHYHLKTLQDREYVVQKGNRFYLGLEFVNTAKHVRRRSDVFEAAIPMVEELATETGEGVSLVAEDHGVAIVLFSRRGGGRSHPTAQGKKLPMHASAPGKAILAHLSDERVQEILDHTGLPQRTENTITDRETLMEELETIRQSEVAYNYMEDFTGIRGVAVPLQNPRGEVEGALSVHGPDHRLQSEAFTTEIPDLLHEYANKIQLDLEFNK